MTESVRWRRCANVEQLSRQAACRIADTVRARPGAVVGLATGSTPQGTYAELARMHRDEGLRFAGVRTFNLDEYRGLQGEHEQSYRCFMNENLFCHVDIAPQNTHVLNGMADDIAVECQAFEDQIAELGGIDLWLLGIGANGHIAFNEPGSESHSRTRLVDLAPETVVANSRFFTDSKDVPRQALTVGIGTILEARHLLLLATGASKAQAVATALNEPANSSCPASLLQEHRDCTFLVDAAAAAALGESPETSL
jgi:glucosamine-6-phosphate deaminase